MRKLTTAVVLLSAVSLFGAHDHHSSSGDLKEELKKKSKHGTVIAQPAVINPNATARTFNITARANPFQFDISPSPFVVEKGDTVTLNVTVAANDGSPSGHGILMESYIENAVNVGKGQTRQFTFVATTAGEFAFICTQSTCGIGHSSMFGTLTVNEVTVPLGPTVTAVSPATGPVKGGTVVTITGTNFPSNSIVNIGGVAATNVVIVSSTTITARTPKHAAGLVDVEVRLNGTCLLVSCGTPGKNAFTYSTAPVKKWSAPTQP